MCILIEQMQNQHFTFPQIKDFYENNPDGFGAIDPTTGTVEKLPGGDVKRIWRLYKEQYAGKHCILHFRLATSGAHDLANVHPFNVGKTDWVLFHNGVLSNDLWGQHTKGKKDSRNDTRIYIDHYIKPLITAGVHPKSDLFKDLVGRDIGHNNKFILVNRKTAEIVCVNRSSGIYVAEFNGSWMSNTYAWDAALYGYGYKARTLYSWGNTGDICTPKASTGFKYDDYEELYEDAYVPNRSDYIGDVSEYKDYGDTQHADILERVKIIEDGNIGDYLILIDGDVFDEYKFKDDAEYFYDLLTHSRTAFEEACELM
jgi:hypothetical protein